MTDKKAQYLEKRKNLVELSKGLQILVKEGKYDTVNEALNDIYKSQQPEINEFNTFQQWKKKGKTIVKGAKAYLFWGQPTNREQQETTEKSTEIEKKMKFFPICYLFSNLQVV